MDTITVRTAEGQDLDIPVVVAFAAPGRPADLVGDVEPENCDHKGATWSSCFDLRCPRCGSRLFVPPRFLAHRPEDEVKAMHSTWVKAGWPEWSQNRWSIIPAKWTIVNHPLFAALGGLAVRNDRLDSFAGDLVETITDTEGRRS